MVVFGVHTVLVIAASIALEPGTGTPSDSTLEVAREARDRADVSVLRQEIARLQAEANQSNNALALVRLAELHDWLCEALDVWGEREKIEAVARAGIAMAEAVVKRAPTSSRAHMLLGQLLGRLQPHVFAGRIRYGRRSIEELEFAVALNPTSADAHVVRAVWFLDTPSWFGGSPPRALEILDRAVNLDQRSESAHYWLAETYIEVKQCDRAARELGAARRLNPGRRLFTRAEAVLKKRCGP